MDKDSFSNKESYEKIVSHSLEIIDFVDKIKAGNDIDSVDVPDVLKVFIEPDNPENVNKRTEVMKLATSVGGYGSVVALSTINRSTIYQSGNVVGRAMIANGLGRMAIGGLGAGAAMLAPIPAIGIAALLGGAVVLLKKYLNSKQKSKLNDIKNNLSDSKEYISKHSQAEAKKYKEKIENIEKEIEEIFNRYSKKAKEAGRKAAIIFDDAVHINTNKRIQEYQKIALNQYNSLKLLNDEVKTVEDKYNEVLDEFQLLKEKYLQLEQEKQELVERLEKYSRIIGAIESYEGYAS